MEKKSKRQLEELYKRKHRFEQDILAHLKTHGPQPYDSLYVMFDIRRNAEIEIITHELNHWKLIEIGKDSSKTVSLSPAGLARLEELNHPSLKT
jgi:hypothetical protein